MKAFLSLVLTTLFAAPFAAFAAAPSQAAWHTDPIPAVERQDVHFSNGDVRLTGTLFLPAGGDHLPAVVVLQGAEAPTREYALYRHLAEGLPPMGMAVLVYDRRGSGASSGTLTGASYETLADDAIAGARALAGNRRIDARRIGYWGLSQGGWLAVLAAERDRRAAFAVSVSAPLVTASAQMYFAVANDLRVHGYPQEAVTAASDARDAWQGYLRGTRSRDEAVRGLRGIERQPWFDLTFMPTAGQLTTTPQTSSWRKQMDDDPVAAIRSVSVPVLFIYGGADPWIPVGPSVARLRQLRANRPNIDWRVIAGAGHEMTLGAPETMASDRQTLLVAAPNAPAYFTVLASWLQEHAMPAKSQVAAASPRALSRNLL